MGANHPPNTNPKIAKSQENFRILIESEYIKKDRAGQNHNVVISNQQGVILEDEQKRRNFNPKGSSVLICVPLSELKISAIDVRAGSFTRHNAVDRAAIDLVRRVYDFRSIREG